METKDKRTRAWRRHQARRVFKARLKRVGAWQLGPRKLWHEIKDEKAFNQAFALRNPGYVLDAALWEILGGDEFFLGRAFDWSETPEGREFWKEIDLAWGMVCAQA